MPVDFDALVLYPNLEVFSRPVNFYPVVSQPPGAPIVQRGIFDAEHFDIPTEDGGTLSVNNLTLGIRLSEWPLRPSPGDYIGLEDQSFWDVAYLGTYSIYDLQPDGQGGTTLLLKREVRRVGPTP